MPMGFEDNETNVERIIPCPACVDSPYVFDKRPHYFNVDDLKVVATHKGEHHIKCGFTNKDVPLELLVPDVFLNDLQVKFYVQEQHRVCSSTISGTSICSVMAVVIQKEKKN